MEFLQSVYKLVCREAGRFDLYMNLAREERGIKPTLENYKRDAELCGMIQDIKTNKPDEYYNMVIDSEGEEDWGEYSPTAWIFFYILFDKLETVVGAGEWQWGSKTWL